MRQFCRLDLFHLIYFLYKYHYKFYAEFFIQITKNLSISFGLSFLQRFRQVCNLKCTKIFSNYFCGHVEKIIILSGKNFIKKQNPFIKWTAKCNTWKIPNVTFIQKLVNVFDFSVDFWFSIFFHFGVDFWMSVSTIVSTVLKLFLPFFNRVPIEIYGSDAKTWKPKLHLLIDPSQLLPSFGGTKKADNEKTNNIWNFDNKLNKNLV